MSPTSTKFALFMLAMTLGCQRPVVDAVIDPLPLEDYLVEIASDHGDTRANDVSDDGHVAVGHFASPEGQQAFRWTREDGLVPLGDLAGGEFFSSAAGVSADGRVVVGHSLSAEGTEAFVWTAEEGMVGLGDLAGGAFFSQATAVSGDGSVIVGEGRSARGREAFRWTAEDGFAVLKPANSDSPDQGDRAAHDVSADGRVVAGQAHMRGRMAAFRWTPEEGLRESAAYGADIVSNATAVSPDGRVVVGDIYSETGEEAFRWLVGADPVGLVPDPMRIYNYPSAASERGEIIVGRMYSDGKPDEAFIWQQKTGIKSLQSALREEGVDSSDWHLLSAQGISGNGRVIVGFGTNPEGRTVAWKLVRPE